MKIGDLDFTESEIVYMFNVLTNALDAVERRADSYTYGVAFGQIVERAKLDIRGVIILAKARTNDQFNGHKHESKHAESSDEKPETPTSLTGE